MSDAHVFADQQDAAERYLLGQMSDADRDAYEEHFFQCVDCAQEVKATSQFLDDCRAALAYQAIADRLAARGGRRPVFSRAAAGVLAGALAASVLVMTYQNAVTIPRLSRALAPRALTSVSFAAANARGAGQTIAVPRQQPFLIFVDIPPGIADTYDCTIVAKDGQAAVAVTIPAARTQDAVPLLIPAGRLEPGDYTLIVRGRARGAGESPVDVARVPFTLRFAD
jgi:hypothetical protein